MRYLRVTLAVAAAVLVIVPAALGGSSGLLPTAPEDRVDIQPGPSTVVVGDRGTAASRAKTKSRVSAATPDPLSIIPDDPVFGKVGPPTTYEDSLDIKPGPSRVTVGKETAAGEKALKDIVACTLIADDPAYAGAGMRHSSGNSSCAGQADLLGIRICLQVNLSGVWHNRECEPSATTWTTLANTSFIFEQTNPASCLSGFHYYRTLAKQSVTEGGDNGQSTSVSASVGCQP